MCLGAEIAMLVLIGFLTSLGMFPPSAMSYTFIADAISIVVVAAAAMGYFYAVKDQATEIGGAK